jgi:uncharacterized membrane protein (Fun14 family)
MILSIGYRPVVLVASLLAIIVLSSSSSLIDTALKKVVKLVAIVLGLFVAGLAYLQYQHIVNINWNNLQQVSQNAAITVINATKYVPGLIDVSDHKTNLTMSNFGVPLTGSMAVGFTLGFMRG